MAELGGVNLSNMFQKITSGISEDGNALQTKINSLSSGKVEQKDLLEMQFAMGQYNAKVEALSNITKAMTDILKSLSQRQG